MPVPSRTQRTLDFLSRRIRPYRPDGLYVPGGLYGPGGPGSPLQEGKKGRI